MSAIKTMLKQLVLPLLLVVAGIAQAALVPQVNFVELGFETVGVPAHEAERFTIVPCRNCDPLTVRLTADTIYRLDGHRSTPVTFRDYRLAIQASDSRESLLFYVGYDVDTNEVVELVLAAGQ